MRKQPKHVDVDKPHGWLKVKWRRWLRRVIGRDTKQQVQEYCL